MIEWLNCNQGFIMIVLTLVYVLATIVLVMMNRSSINEMKKAREEETRPYVIVNLSKDPRDRCFYLRIKNYGKTGAVINNLQIKPSLNLVKDGKEEVSIKGCLIPPDYAIQLLILEEWEATCEKTYSVSLSYSSLENKPRCFEENYPLISQYAHLQGYTDKKLSSGNQPIENIQNSLANISDYLDSIRNKM